MLRAVKLHQSCARSMQYGNIHAKES